MAKKKFSEWVSELLMDKYVQRVAKKSERDRADDVKHMYTYTYIAVEFLLYVLADFSLMKKKCNCNNYNQFGYMIYNKML